MAAKEWMVETDLSGGLAGGQVVNESTSGGIEWMTASGEFISEDAAAGAPTVGVLVVGSTSHIFGGFVVT